MSDAPKTIWARPDPYEPDWTGDKTLRSKAHVEYRRADLPPTTEQLMADPRVKAMVEALKECRDDLDGYSQNEYPADHPVHISYRKRDYDANPARIALAAFTKEPKE